MESSRPAVAAYFVWLIVSVVASAAVAGLLASSIFEGTRGVLWLVGPLSLLVIGPLGAASFVSTAWGKGHYPSKGSPLPVAMALVQAGTVYVLTSRFLDGDAAATDDLQKGGLVFVVLLLGIAASAIAGSVAILFLRDRNPA